MSAQWVEIEVVVTHTDSGIQTTKVFKEESLSLDALLDEYPIEEHTFAVGLTEASRVLVAQMEVALSQAAIAEAKK